MGPSLFIHFLAVALVGVGNIYIYALLACTASFAFDMNALSVAILTLVAGLSERQFNIVDTIVVSSLLQTINHVSAGCLGFCSHWAGVIAAYFSQSIPPLLLFQSFFFIINAK